MSRASTTEMSRAIAASPERRRARKRLRRVLIAAILGTSALLCVLLTLASARPGWYQPRSVDFATLAADKAALLDLENTISDALNAGRSVDIELRADQVNRWLAAAREIGAGMWSPPAEIQQPAVRFRDGTIDLAAVCTAGGVPAILGASGAVRIEGDTIVLSGAVGRVGRLPIPLAWVRALGAKLPAAGDAARSGSGDLVWKNEFTWENGRRRFRVVLCRVETGVVRVELAPLASR